MELGELWLRLEELPLAIYIGETSWFPMIESIHVLAATLVFGSLLMVDLRLLGLAARRYQISRVVGELVPWSVGAFVVAVMAGAGLFITRANGYMNNTAFQIKLVLLALAGINIAVFHLRTFRNAAEWEESSSSPFMARLAGSASLGIWAGVMLAGRWIGHLP